MCYHTKEHWVKVRHIPGTLAQYNGDDRFMGTESYGDPKNSSKCWGIKFKHLQFDTVKVESEDKTYCRIYSKVAFLGKMQEDDLLKNKNLLHTSDGASIYIVDRNKVFRAINEANDKKWLVAASTYNDVKNDSIARHHAYSILKSAVVEDSVGAQCNILKLRDPYGKANWSGDWNPYSARWSSKA